MALTDIAGKFVLMFYEDFPQGTVEHFGGVFTDRWLAFQHGQRHLLNNQKPGRVDVLVFDPFDGNEKYTKLTTYSYNKQAQEAYREEVSGQARC